MSPPTSGTRARPYRRWLAPRSKPSASTWWPVPTPRWPGYPSWPARRWWPGSSTGATSGAPTWRRRWARWRPCWVRRLPWPSRRRARHCTCRTRWNRKPTWMTRCGAGWRSVPKRCAKSSFSRVPCATDTTRSPTRSRRPAPPSRPASATRGYTMGKSGRASRRSSRPEPTAAMPPSAAPAKTRDCTCRRCRPRRSAPTRRPRRSALRVRRCGPVRSTRPSTCAGCGKRSPR